MQTTFSKKTKKNRRQATASLTATKQAKNLIHYASLPSEEALSELDVTVAGLTKEEVAQRRERFGWNEIDHDKPAPAILQFFRAFLNPFILILIFLATIMVFTDVIFIAPGEDPDFTGVVTISLMVLVSASLRFWQEYRTARDVEQLKAMVRTTTAVTRLKNGISSTKERPIEELVPGDIIELAAGDMLPADVRFLRAKDLEVNQAMLTGEAIPAEKTAEAASDLKDADIFDAENIGFMGTSVVSGSGTAVVVATAAKSYFGGMASQITGQRVETAFDKGIKKITYTLIRFMVVMVPVVFIINGLTKDWTSAFLFGVTTAVGLTPEMLPLIVTANLAKGARYMAKRKVIVKQLNSIQNLGAMDVLCTDKTGTLTEDRIVLQDHLDGDGKPSQRALILGAANAQFQTGLRNLLDKAILEAAAEEDIEAQFMKFTMVDEMPFDFARRRMSVVLTVPDSDNVIITKGAVEEVLSICTHEEVNGEVLPLSAGRLAQIEGVVARQNARGMRVLALGARLAPTPTNGDEYSQADERDLVLIGLLTFLDPPKESAAKAIASLQSHGTAVKVITGDNPLVAATVCKKVGLSADQIVLGSQLDDLTDDELAALARETNVFAKVNPLQKARIVSAMREGGHTVGFLGDGINDAPALRAADVGISVDSAVDIAKESADIILLEKDLTVLEGGVKEGRRTYVNTMKYIKMTASSNFGNMFSVLVASALLPFLPMIPLVVLVQNLAYDLSMLTLPWDRVDKEDIEKPRVWDASGLTKFMLRIGPLSSIFDITTFALMWFVFAANTNDPANVALFQSGWFIESIISQTLIVHMIRTKKVPFIQSSASLSVLLATGLVCVFGLVLPFTSWGQIIGLTPLPLSYFPWLILTLASYCVLTQLMKRVYLKTTKTWI